MKKLYFLLIFTLCYAISTAQAFTIFACEAEWAVMAKVLLPSAKIFVATTHQQDPHHIEARPALIAQLRNADLAICTGAFLERGWLPSLQQLSNNAKVQNGQPGMFYASQFVNLIDPQEVKMSNLLADVHPEGNPHIHADPYRLIEVSTHLTKRLQQLVPDKANNIAQNQQVFAETLTNKIKEWERLAQPLKGKDIIIQHTSFLYLWRWLGLNPIADLEPQPGLPPNPIHLREVLSIAQKKSPIAVVIAEYQNPNGGNWIKERLQGVPVIKLPATVSDVEKDSLFHWFDQLIQTLLTTSK